MAWPLKRQWAVAPFLLTCGGEVRVHHRICPGRATRARARLADATNGSILSVFGAIYGSRKHGWLPLFRLYYPGGSGWPPEVRRSPPAGHPLRVPRHPSPLNRASGAASSRGTNSLTPAAWCDRRYPPQRFRVKGLVEGPDASQRLERHLRRAPLGARRVFRSAGLGRNDSGGEAEGNSAPVSHTRELASAPAWAGNPVGFPPPLPIRAGIWNGITTRGSAFNAP